MANSAPSDAKSSPGSTLTPGGILESEKSPVFIRSATIVSRNAERLADFYIGKLGFERINDGANTIELGAGGTAFLTLKNRPDATPFDPASSGLFHIAYLLPDRAGLARWFLASRAAGVPFEGASDHAVSEAFYLTDPDGNGIEIYVDRARETWPRDSHGYAMTTGPMALRDLVAGIDASDVPAPQLPAGTRIGHIHLQTGNAETAAHFWQEKFDLAETHRRPGVRFLSWGGYHHHVAINNWRSHGSGPREANSAGLFAIEFDVREDSVMAQIANKAGATLAGHGSFEIGEPGGVFLRFRQV